MSIQKLLDLISALKGFGFVLPKNYDDQYDWGAKFLQIVKICGITPQDVISIFEANGCYTFRGLSGDQELFMLLNAAYSELAAAERAAKEAAPQG